MRITVTLDDDVVAALKRIEREEGATFDRALNTAVRAGLASSTETARASYSVEPFRAEIQPGIDLTTATDS